jgi:hypothetical protein
MLRPISLHFAVSPDSHFKWPQPPRMAPVSSSFSRAHSNFYSLLLLFVWFPCRERWPLLMSCLNQGLFVFLSCCYCFSVEIFSPHNFAVALRCAKKVPQSPAQGGLFREVIQKELEWFFKIGGQLFFLFFFSFLLPCFRPAHTIFNSLELGRCLRRKGR